jgi:hypothetical protein
VQVQAESPDPPAGKDVSVIVTAAGLHNNTPPLLTPDEVLVYRAPEQLPEHKRAKAIQQCCIPANAGVQIVQGPTVFAG